MQPSLDATKKNYLHNLSRPRKQNAKTIAQLLLMLTPYTFVNILTAALFTTLKITSPRSKLHTHGVIFGALVLTSILVSVIQNGTFSLVHSALFLTLLCPVLYFICFKSELARNTRPDWKFTLEFLIWIQIVFCFLSGVAAIALGMHGNIDGTFGDVFAGTMRLPGSSRLDANNKVLAFLLVLLTYIYSVCIEKKSLLLIAASCITILIASVNHITFLFLIAFIASRINPKQLLKHPKILLSASLLGTLFFVTYNYLLPETKNTVESRFESLTPAGTSQLQRAVAVNEKIAYMVNFYRDVTENPIPYWTFGIGPGTYSSRAAMQLSGHLGNLKIESSFEQFENNAGSLWVSFSKKEQWEKGAFYWPYNEAVSLLAELGIPITLYFTYLLLRRLKKLGFLSRQDKLFISIFLISTSFVDHYLEYSNAMAVFAFVMVGLAESHSAKRISANL